MTAIGEVTEGDLGFADSMALVERAAFHAVPVPLGETVLARRLLGRAGLDIPEGALTVVAPGVASDAALSGGTLAGLARGVPWGRSIRHAVLAAGDTVVLADISGATTELGVNMADEPRDTLDLGRAAGDRVGARWPVRRDPWRPMGRCCARCSSRARCRACWSTA